MSMFFPKFLLAKLNISIKVKLTKVRKRNTHFTPLHTLLLSKVFVIFKGIHWLFTEKLFLHFPSIVHWYSTLLDYKPVA